MAIKLDEARIRLLNIANTGSIVLPVGTDVYSNASLFFGTKTRIGTGTNNTFGIYSTGKIMLRPNNGTLGYAEGLELSPSALIPTKNNTVTLGDTTHKWANIYATTFTGALSGNASTATNVAWSGVTGKPSTFPPSSHTHNYAGSSSAGGAATTAISLSRSSATLTIPAAGWYKLAYANTADPRGSVRLGLFTQGGSYSPRYTELKMSNGWSNVEFSQLGKFDWINKYRLTTDDSHSYIEAYFTGACEITIVKRNGDTEVDDSASTIWQLYTTVTAGSGTVAGGEHVHNITSSFYSSGYIQGDGFIRTDSDNNYVLLGAGGHAAISTLNVASATKATQDGSGNTITSKYVAVDTTQTISGAKTFSKTITLSTQNYITVSDRAYILTKYSDFQYSSLTPSNTSGNEEFMKAALKAMCSKYPGFNQPILLGNLGPNSQGPMYGSIYSTSTVNSETGLPQYSTFWFSNINGNLGIFGTSSYNYYYRTVLDSSNYTSYTVTKTGSGASGTWGISISGTAAKATILANARSLKISSTPGTTGTSFNGSADATLIIPTTVKTFTELGTNKISSSAALYISPASTLYLQSAASASLIFQPQGTERARFDTSGNFVIKTAMYPGTNNTYNLGTSDYKWKNVYATNYYGEAQTLAYGSAYPGGNTSKIWHEVATFSQKNTGQINTKLVLYVSNFYSTESSGILEITARQQTSATTPDWVKLNFITASGSITLSDFVATWKYDSSTTTTTIKLYVKRSGWTSFNLTKIVEHSWGAITNTWALKKVSSIGITAIPTDETQIAATVSDNTFSGVYFINGTITSNIRSQNTSFLHYSTTATSGHWFNKAIYVSGDIYAGSSYNQKVLHAGNYNDYTVTKTGSGASGTWGISISGNAATATKLATARTINGVSFDGSKNISFAGTYVSNTAYNTIPAGLSYIEMPATATVTGDPQYGALLSVVYGGGRAFQLVGNSSNNLYFRGMHSGLTSDAGTGYGVWRTILHSGNYTSYTVTKTGSGASGTWGISISGNAATASSVAWGNVTGKPSTFTPSSHTHSYITSKGATVANTRTPAHSESLITGGWSTADAGYGSTYGTTLDVSGYSTWYHRLAFHTNGQIDYWMGINTTTLTKQSTLITSSNYNSYAPSKTGSGASGTWGISITGNAATSTTATSATKDGESNTIHSTYLKKSGGTVSGQVSSSATVTPANAAFRNIKVVAPSTTITAGTTAIPDGEIWIRYE